MLMHRIHQDVRSPHLGILPQRTIGHHTSDLQGGEVQSASKGRGNVTEMIIGGIFPWCFTPELYAAKPEYIGQLAAFVRGRPKQPLMPSSVNPMQ
jgi:hypothetical protein